jgi:hypothetical protein
MKIPHSPLIKHVSNKRNQENYENEDHDEIFDLLLNLQDASIPATGVFEFERGWAVKEMKKKSDEKRRKDIAARKAATPIINVQLDSNNDLDASKKGKMQSLGKGESLIACKITRRYKKGRATGPTSMDQM